MDERILKELELLPVARLYGFDSPRERADAAAVVAAPAAAAPWPARTRSAPDEAPRRAPAAPPPEPPEGIAGMDWAALRQAVRDCRRCVLCERRKQAVFGVGNESAPWLFVGEGPGAEEDEKGEPFTSEAICRSSKPGDEISPPYCEEAVQQALKSGKPVVY